MIVTAAMWIPTIAGTYCCYKMIAEPVLTLADIDRIMEMAWEDRTTFEAISYQFGLSADQVVSLMRREMKPSSFRMWRKRTQGRSTKHARLRIAKGTRFKCSRQRTISGNKITKR